MPAASGRAGGTVLLHQWRWYECCASYPVHGYACSAAESTWTGCAIRCGVKTSGAAATSQRLGEGGQKSDELRTCIALGA